MTACLRGLLVLTAAALVAWLCAERAYAQSDVQAEANIADVLLTGEPEARRGGTPAADNGSRQDLPDVYEIDFREKNFDHGTLVPLGFKSLYGLKLLKPEPRGLRIIIPSHQGTAKPNIGITPAFEIEGDFEVTAGYDLVTAETPSRGAGAGANLYLMASETRHGATLRRCVNREGQHVYFVHWTRRNDGGELERQVKYVPAESRRGQLRLVRQGSRLHYLVAEQSGEFREIHSVEFGREPIGLLRLEAHTDGAPSTVDVLWNQFTARAEKLRSVAIPLYEKAAANAETGGAATETPGGEVPQS